MTLYALTFPAMGTTVVVQADRVAALDAARARIMKLEQRWSRFDPQSEISHLNEGAAVALSDDTVLLLRHMRDAWSFTQGLFNPSVAPALARLGASSGSGGNGVVSSDLGTTLADVRIADVAFRLDPGVTLDPGAIGKGLAADVVLYELVSGGCVEACVSIGGDLAFHGRPRTIDVAHPAGGCSIASLATRSGGVATSSTTGRRYPGGHHVIDPRTGRPTENDLVQVTVAANTAAWAEALATACLVAGDVEPAERCSVGALAVTTDGTILRSSAWVSLDADPTRGAVGDAVVGAV